MPTLRDLRIEARLTTVQLSAKSNVSLSSINRMERGKRAVKRLMATRVLYALSQELGRTIMIDDVEGLQIVD
jgi:transcriptional regulator with XRE-family HTH domain